MNSLKLTTLENALRYWEDQNIIADLYFTAENNKLLQPTKKLRPLPGSEINSVGLFGRKIPNFESLRNDLRKGFFNPIGYLPRIPKKDSENVQEIIEKSFFFPLLPMVFSDWVSTKKVCRVFQDSNIPLITNKNYLKNIPYDNFILLLDDPFSHKTNDESGAEIILDYSTFFISKDENVINVYALSDDIKNNLISEDLKKDILGATNFAIRKRKSEFDKLISKVNLSLSKIKDRPHFSFIKFQIEIDNPFLKVSSRVQISIFKTFSNILKKVFGKSVYNESVADFTALNLMKKVSDWESGLYGFFPKFLNGICKILLENGGVLNENNPKPSNGSNISSLSKKHDMEWNEVPLGTILDLSVDKDGKVEILRSNETGSEKSYHIRSGHYRKYIQKDGSVKSVWIKSAKIRPDKSPEFGGSVMSGVKTIK